MSGSFCDPLPVDEQSLRLQFVTFCTNYDQAPDGTTESEPTSIDLLSPT